jgi:hypothetical protein
MLLLIYFLGTTNKMSLFSIYFISITLYMFRVEPPPIIRSSDCDHGWDGTATAVPYQSRFDKIPEAVCTVRAPDDGWRFHPKLVERY